MHHNCLVCDINVRVAPDYRHIFKNDITVDKLEKILSIRVVEAVCSAPYLCVECTEKLESIIVLLDKINQAYRESVRKHSSDSDSVYSPRTLYKEPDVTEGNLAAGDPGVKTGGGSRGGETFPCRCHSGCVVHHKKRDAQTQLNVDDLAESARGTNQKPAVKKCRGRPRKSKSVVRVSQRTSTSKKDVRRRGTRTQRILRSRPPKEGLNEEITEDIYSDTEDSLYLWVEKEEDEEEREDAADDRISVSCTKNSLDTALAEPALFNHHSHGHMTEPGHVTDVDHVTPKEEPEGVVLEVLECQSVDPAGEDVDTKEVVIRPSYDDKPSDTSNLTPNIHERKKQGPLKRMTEKQTTAKCKSLTKNRPHKVTSVLLGEKRYKCDQCGAAFAKGDKLKRHVRVHTGEKPYACPNCSRRFAAKYQMQRHNMQIHTGERPFKCSVCQHGFTELKALRIHMRKHTGERPYSCTLCMHSFSQAYSLKLHMRTHTGDYPYKCDHCEAGFSRADAYKVHLRRHTGEKPFKCSECDALFADPQNFKKHQRHHKGDRHYKCPVCSTSFVQSNSLKEHMRKHTGERPYLCSICGASFAHQSSFSQHCKAHTGEKPHKCPHCSKSFADSRVLKVHVRTHTGERPYMCSTCGKAFAHHGQLSRHTFSHTGERPHQCYRCGRRFARKDKLNRHIQRIHGREEGYVGPPYPAPEPGSFLEPETKEIIRPYECRACGKKYSRKDKLKDHIRKSHMQPIDLGLLPCEANSSTDLSVQGFTSNPCPTNSTPVSNTVGSAPGSNLAGVMSSVVSRLPQSSNVPVTETNEKLMVISHPFTPDHPPTLYPIPSLTGGQFLMPEQPPVRVNPPGTPALQVVTAQSPVGVQQPVTFSTVSQNMCQELNLAVMHLQPTPYTLGNRPNQ